MLTIHRVCAGGMLALCLTPFVATAQAGDAVVQKFGNWTVTIQPGMRAPAAVQAPMPGDTSSPSPAKSENPTASLQPTTPATGDLAASPAAIPGGRSVDPKQLGQLYTQVYNAIPFSRPEYEANASYRHDATMEFLFGQMRSTVIQRGTSVINQNTPLQSTPGFSNCNNYQPNAYSQYGFNSYYYPFMWGYNP